MEKCQLSFTIQVKTKLIDGIVVDGPGVGNIPLLEALCGCCSEAWEVGTGEFESGEWVVCPGVLEIVIDAQVLLIIQSMVDFGGEIVAAYRLNGYSANQGAPIRRDGNKLENIDRGGIHTRKRNLAVRENIGIISSVGNRSSVLSNRSRVRLAVGAVCENRRVRQRPSKRAHL